MDGRRAAVHRRQEKVSACKKLGRGYYPCGAESDFLCQGSTPRFASSRGSERRPDGDGMRERGPESFGKYKSWLGAAALFSALIFAGSQASHSQQQRKKAPPVPGPMLQEGFIDLDTPAFSLKLVRSSQTVAALKSKDAADFDFTPGDLLVERSQDGYYHLGDLDLRLRQAGTSEWKGYSTALARKPVTALAATSGVLAAADLTPTLPEDIPLKVTRSWEIRDGVLA